MAGFWHLSHHQLRDEDGEILSGAKAYFYEADTLDPITVYQDYGLGTAHPNPVTANGIGVFPPVFFDEADEFYRQRITTSAGVLVEGTDVGTIPIIGPTGGGGGSETPVDANSILKTGDFFWQPVTGTRAGFVRANARTIGSATSGASERANADAETLYLHLWNTYSDTICPVSGGRGANAAADWAANKPIGTPDARGLAPIGVADMGNSDSGLLNGITFDVGSKTAAMSRVGAVTHTLVDEELPTITPAGTVAADDLDIGSAGLNVAGGAAQVIRPGFGPTSVTAVFTGTPFGSDDPHNNTQPSMTGTWYVKL